MKARHHNHPLLATEQDIEMAQADLTLRLERWRDLQAIHMPEVNPLVLSQNSAELEDDCLFLPSHFSEEDCDRLSIKYLAEEEVNLRQAHAYDCILQLRRVMKTISALQKLRRKHARGQRQTTRSRLQVDSMELSRDQLLAIYNASHRALRSLRTGNTELEGQFPSLALEDLYRKSTVDKRQLGDTYHVEGKLWWAGGAKHTSTPDSPTAFTYPGTISATQAFVDNTELAQAHVDNAEPDNEHPVVLGKLWGHVIGLSETEVEEWEREGKYYSTEQQLDSKAF
jgi:hypothetical protein